jgi:hypothetical protein
MLHSSLTVLSLLDDDFPHTTFGPAVPLLSFVQPYASLHLFIGISRHRIPILRRWTAIKGISLYIILNKRYTLVKSTTIYIWVMCRLFLCRWAVDR